MNLKSKVDSIRSRIDFIDFLHSLRNDLDENPGEWQNLTLGHFLEAMSAWASDMEGYYLNNQLPVPTSPNWRNFAEMMLAAKYYE